jgi:cytidine deaminase
LQRKSRHIDYEIYADSRELLPEEALLLEKALEATNLAYAPHSQFRVGCAVLLDDGEIILGNNQENRAYPSGLCAERTALFHIGATGKAHKIRKIAIRARSERTSIDEPAMPCGGCRQVMVEYEKQAGQHFVVLSQGATGPILRLESVQDSLIPFSFDIEF